VMKTPLENFFPEAGSSPAMLSEVKKIEDCSKSRLVAPTAVKSNFAG
jgi:hypothetical protein